MTKLEVKIKNPKLVCTKNKKNGAYLATFTNPDDRILIYHLGKIEEVINNDGNGELWLQGASHAPYFNLKKIKKMTLEVELE